MLLSFDEEKFVRTFDVYKYQIRNFFEGGILFSNSQKNIKYLSSIYNLWFDDFEEKWSKNDYSANNIEICIIKNQIAIVKNGKEEKFNISKEILNLTTNNAFLDFLDNCKTTVTDYYCELEFYFKALNDKNSIIKCSEKKDTINNCLFVFRNYIYHFDMFFEIIEQLKNK
jgi:hypothetical protein